VSDAAGAAPPLAGRRVLITRPREQATALAQQLEAAGAIVIVSPTIRIVPPADPEPFLRAVSAITQFDWIVFASANAVDAVIAAAADPASLRGPTIAAVGSRTADRLRAHGIDVAVVPAEFRAEALVEALTAHGRLSGTRVLLPRSEIGRETIAEGLRAAGALVTDVVAYRTVSESAEGTLDVRGMLTDGQLDAVTFTSGSAVRSFAHTYGHDTVDLLRNAVVAVIGPVTADVAREVGIEVHVQPAVYTTAAMVEALADYFERRNRALESRAPKTG
jgi:uroporphyrinogen III methyltransferase / synthase